MSNELIIRAAKAEEERRIDTIIAWSKKTLSICSFLCLTFSLLFFSTEIDKWEGGYALRGIQEASLFDDSNPRFFLVKAMW